MGIFVDATNCEGMQSVYTEFTGIGQDFREFVRAAKKKVLETSMRSEVSQLTRLLRLIASKTRYGVDLSLSSLRDAVTKVAAALPVYRTYVNEGAMNPSRTEEVVILEATRETREEKDRESSYALKFLQKILLLNPPADLDEGGSRLCRHFVMRFQQLTGPVMAKGLEDTSYYNFNRLISLNEVGGNPGKFGTNLEAFHEHNRTRAEHWPHAMVTTATHDTKRGEDTRARLNVLSELPEDWRRAISKWSRLNANKKTCIGDEAAPDANDEYFLYQTLVGSWVTDAETEAGLKVFRKRISAFMLKAVREAKRHTSWSEPNQQYEQATQIFVESVLANLTANPFLDDFMLFHRRVAFFGIFNSLAQVVLKLTVPGVPDFYQGTELWDFSLVDPDNRRPVDYERRRELLRDLQEQLAGVAPDMPGFLRRLLKNYQTGQIKLYIIWKLLELRRKQSHLFEQGGYTPLMAFGPKQEHACAFARKHDGVETITVAARLVVGLSQGAGRDALEPEVWQDTILPILGARPGDYYRNVLTQEVLEVTHHGNGFPLRKVLGLLPVAVLERVQRS
jgi:(1->4)-alpha-D-glucan 1-alpha-D-glucosylmutase